MAATSCRCSSMRSGWDISSHSLGKATHNTRWRAGGPCSRLGMLTAITTAFTLRLRPRGSRKSFQNGSIIVDLRTWIVLPAQAADWKPNDLKIAYSQLANVSISEISPEAETGLKCQFVGAYELLAVCYEQGEPPPPFWLHWDTTRRSSRVKTAKFFLGRAETASWLHQRLLGAKPSDVRREDVLEEARSRFSLGEDQFNKLWRAFAPDQLKEGGRRPGSKKRHPAR